MENTALNKREQVQVVEYRVLVDSLKDLQVCKEKLDEFIRFQTEFFSELESFLQDWQVRRDLDTIIEDVNAMLANPSAAENVTKLKGSLNNAKADVAKLEKAVKDLESEYDQLCKLPERHGKVEIVQRVRLFVNSLKGLHIVQIRHAVDTVIPGLFREMQAVFKAFEIEKRKCEENVKLADQLLERITVLCGYADKFKCRSICKSCTSKINEVSKLDRVDPDNDRKILHAVEKTLDALEAAYTQEQEQFNDLKMKVKMEKEKVWKEDYDGFMPVFDKPSCMVANTIDDLRVMFEGYKARKRGDIDNVQTEYGGKSIPRGSKILEHFDNDFSVIRSKFVSESELQSLIGKMDFYISERRKKILITLGIIAAVLVGVVIIIQYWQYILAGLAIAGVIGILALKD